MSDQYVDAPETFTDTRESSQETETDTESEDTATPPRRRLVLWKGDISLVSSLSSLAINLFLPFVNGMMLGFGEILAHELGFKLGWAGARVGRV